LRTFKQNIEENGSKKKESLERKIGGKKIKIGAALMMGKYWLGKTKPKQAIRSTPNAFKKLPWNLKKILFNRIF